MFCIYFLRMRISFLVVSYVYAANCSASLDIFNFAHYTHNPIVIDGNLSDSAWKEIEWSANTVLSFQSSSSSSPSSVSNGKNALAKIRWDDEFLYLGAILEEPLEWINISSTPYCNIGSQHPLITNEEFESLARDSKAFGLEHTVSVTREFCMVKNKLRDGTNQSLFNSSQKMFGPIMFKTLSFCESHVVEGNFPHWQVEIAIPLEQLDRHRKPGEGQAWTISLERVQWAVAEDKLQARPLARKSAIRMFVQSGDRVHVSLKYLIRSPLVIIALTLLFQFGSAATIALMAKDVHIFSAQFPRKTHRYVRGYLDAFCLHIFYKIVAEFFVSHEVDTNWFRCFEICYAFVQASCLSLLLWRSRAVKRGLGLKSEAAAQLRSILSSPLLRICLLSKIIYLVVADLMMIRCKLGYEHSSYINASVDSIQNYDQLQNMILIAVYVRLTMISEDEPTSLDHRYTEMLSFSPLLNAENPLYQYETCSICLKDYVFEDQLRRLPCAHHFHIKCIDDWRVIQDKCPLCQHAVDEMFVKSR